MLSSGLSLPNKACHNCRRKRWKCDRSLPTCQKCLSTGSECLGYGKLFIWNQGVASRGKMMGKSFADTEPLDGTRKLSKEREAGSHSGSHPTSEPSVINQSGVVVASQAGLASPGVDRSIAPVAIYKDPAAREIARALAEPLTAHLDERYRDYLVHFATKLCADMVAYDGPGKNPMRELVPATSSFPFLLHIMIANSAFHVFNISKGPIHIQEEEGHNNAELIWRNAPNQKFYRDALVAKQKALGSLAQFLATVSPINFDLVLAAILLFVNYDLIESGKEQWKPHLEGAQKLVSLLGTPPYILPGKSMSHLRIYLLSDYLVFSVLGSTFRFSSSAKLFPDTVDIEPILQYAETNNYLSCPAPLLRIMLGSFNLSDSIDSEESLTVQHELKLKELIEMTLSFDPAAWLQQFKPASPFEDLSKRFHIVSALRSAVCIYLVRFIPITNPLLDPSGGTAVVSLTGLANDVVQHLSQLSPSDTLYKSITWPLFLAGAESEDPDERAWIMGSLDTFYAQMHWGYVHTVKRVLEAVWRFKEEGALCWVTEVKKMGGEILIA
ncbi:uncharacterized protein EI97DRAFT_385719 [Westerdykella ornata]|uniref:Zn(2)-C6 fungal-type domain-containing protein n=1 Tax=Westerdykella ornata TaxID=318751 RepID=A0A6A6J8I6_WESOR|nr:uncharacterized protein EI97DRAFT_385719 [Westerdykella ornata]KAF2272514.1 hypothetical protein EI97DRAFT_385719 [Westerdykella ornata]